MVKTVIFDMDGVLINSEPIHHQVSQIQYNELNIKVSDAIFSTFTGNSNKMIYQKLKNTFQLPHEVEDLISRKNELFIEAFHANADLQLLPGVKDLIIDLHQNGVQLIVASSSEMEVINLIFERFGLNPYFTHKVSGNDFPESKPNPAIFLKAASHSVAPIEECVIIEDSTNGIKAAKAAEIFCIAYKSAEVNSQDQSLADKVIYDYTTLNYENFKTINS